MGSGPRAVVVADLNGDGFDDAVTANTGFASSSTDISVLISRGDGTFEPERRFEVGRSPNGLIAEDLNGDNRIDLAVIALSGSPDVVDLAGNG